MRIWMDLLQVHVTGDLVVLETVLTGLSVSQLESTAISLAVSFVVLLLLTRRLIPRWWCCPQSCFPPCGWWVPWCSSGSNGT